jgi:hypothetical protein
MWLCKEDMMNAQFGFCDQVHNRRYSVMISMAKLHAISDHRKVVATIYCSLLVLSS